MSLESFYSSSVWKKFRAGMIAENIAQYGYLKDEYTGNQIVAPYDAICHHKTPLTEQNVNDPYVALNPDNIMIVSHASHDAIHNRFGNGRRAVYLVWGAPKAGKSWYVNSVRTRNDITVDIESLYEALGSELGTRKVAPVVFRVRDELYDMIRTRYGRWDNAYVVGTYPIEMERKRLIDTLRAEEVFIDTPMETCLERCRNEEEMGYVREWFRETEAQRRADAGVQ